MSGAPPALDPASGAAAPDLARWLGLAASPAFAVMALLTGCVGAGPMEAMCSAAHGPHVGGMVPMYVLMSAFHSPPWLRLVQGARGAPAVTAQVGLAERGAASSV